MISMKMLTSVDPFSGGVFLISVNVNPFYKMTTEGNVSRSVNERDSI